MQQMERAMEDKLQGMASGIETQQRQIAEMDRLIESQQRQIED